MEQEPTQPCEDNKLSSSSSSPENSRRWNKIPRWYELEPTPEPASEPKRRIPRWYELEPTGQSTPELIHPEEITPPEGELLAHLQPAEMDRLYAVMTSAQVERLLTIMTSTEVKRLLAEGGSGEVERWLAQMTRAEVERLLSDLPYAERNRLHAQTFWVGLRQLLTETSSSEVKSRLVRMTSADLERLRILLSHGQESLATLQDGKSCESALQTVPEKQSFDISHSKPQKNSDAPHPAWGCGCLTLVVMGIVAAILLTISVCTVSDADCRDASRTANYSTNPDEIGKAMEFFYKNCN